jgi:glycosyltransferase involved in cell wall biosynthesis
MLEAAALHVPMICFSDSGGGPEFAANGAGVVVPYLDVSAFGDCVLKLADDRERRRTVGAVAATKVAGQFTIDRQAPKLRDVIRKFARPPAAP